MGRRGEMFFSNSLMFLGKLGPARFEQRPTILKYREITVGRRGETPLVPPYILCNFKLDGALLRLPETIVPVGCKFVPFLNLPDHGDSECTEP